MILRRSDGYGLGGSADGACVGFHALGRMRGLRGDAAVIPGVFLGFGLAACAVSVVMQAVLGIRPVSKRVVVRIGGNAFGLGRTAGHAGQGQDAFRGMGRFGSDSSAVPGVAIGLDVAAGADSVVGRAILGVGPPAIGVRGRRGDGLGLGGSADGAGVGFHALDRMGGRRGDGTVVPGVFLGFGLAAGAVSVVMFSVFRVGPGAEIVRAASGRNAFGLRRPAILADVEVQTFFGMRRFFHE